MSKQPINPVVSEYMAALGRKGGKWGKGTPRRRQMAINAINARWAKRKEGQKP